MARFERPPQALDPKLELGAFTRWGYDERGWSRQTREQCPQVIAQAGRWLLERRHRSIRRASALRRIAAPSMGKPTPRVAVFQGVIVTQSK